jgi:tRNA-Thr(GGU) m(6)t(6)A37 methyltransferase TsaA
MILLNPVGRVQSSLTDREHAPKQGYEGAPDAWLIFDDEYAPALGDVRCGTDILVLTWLHRGDRETLRVQPRDDPRAPLTGVFSTRSQDRPNPIGIHRVRVLEIKRPTELKVADLEAFDGTPILDVKAVLPRDR